MLWCCFLSVRKWQLSLHHASTTWKGVVLVLLRETLNQFAYESSLIYVRNGAKEEHELKRGSECYSRKITLSQILLLT